MANTYTRDREVYHTKDAMPMTIRYSFNFTCNGTGAPTVSSGPLTVTRTGVGTYAVTFATSFVEVLGISVDPWGATGSTVRAVPIAASVTPGALNTPASFNIETQSAAGTKADLTGAVISVDVAFRKGVTKK